MMRIGLFLATNIAILLVLSIVMSVFGVTAFTAEYGVNWGGMLIICAVIGFTGSFISLAISKWIALKTTGAKIIKNPANQREAWVKSTTERLSKQAGIGLPDVAIYQSSDVNAFATGMNKNNALIAVSSALLDAMSETEAEAVLAHEVGHVANGDMVTMALIQGVVNTFVVFLSRVAGMIVDKVVLGNRDGGPGIGYYVSSIVFQIIFGILASTIVMWFSRKREFRADAAAGKLTSNQSMIGALRKLQQIHEPVNTPKQMEVLAISGKKGGGFGRLFMTHPPLDERIRALE